MSKSKRRITVSILTALMLFFTVVPYMGSSTSYAAPNHLTYTRSMTIQCPVKKIVYTPQEDDAFQMTITIDTENHYGGVNLPDYNDIDCANYVITDADGNYISNGQLGGIAMNMENIEIENACHNRNLVPGEKIHVYVDLACSKYNHGDDPATLRDDNWNVISFKGIDVNVPYMTYPVNLTPKAGVASVKLNWDSVNYSKGINIDGYRIQRFNEAGTKVLKTEWLYEGKSPVDRGYPYVMNIPYSGKYKVQVTAFDNVNGTKVLGGSTKMITCQSAKAAAPKAKITKISDKKARITIVKAQGATSTEIYQKVNGSWKKIATTTGTKYTATKNNAGKSSYKFKTIVKHDGTAYKSGYSIVYTPKANVKTWSPIYDASEYLYRGKSTVEPVKIYYENGKVKVKALFVNNNKFKANDFEYKITVKVGGVTIGSGTVDVGPVKAKSYIVKTVTLKNCKTGYDLRNGNVKFIRTKVDVSK